MCNRWWRKTTVQKLYHNECSNVSSLGAYCRSYMPTTIHGHEKVAGIVISRKIMFGEKNTTHDVISLSAF